MDWFDPSAYIENSSELTDIYGYWPTFHDAEIEELKLSIADGEPWKVGSSSPVLEMLIHVYDMTNEVTKEGYFVLDKHTLTLLRFRNVEDLALSDFSHQNCIFSLIFGTESMSYPRGDPVGGPPQTILTVKIESSAGLSGHFKCHSAEVVSIEPCDEEGQPTR